jgi:hypothetical protein
LAISDYVPAAINKEDVVAFTSTMYIAFFLNYIGFAILIWTLSLIAEL